MKEEELLWEDLSSKPMLHSRVFDVREKHCTSPDGSEGDYTVIDAPEWVVVLPVLDDKLVLVRQWRHGAGRITTELPGGVREAGEEPSDTALRETAEETGYRAGKLTKLGEVNPNPALFTNRFHVFLAEELTPIGHQELDPDEFIHCLTVPIDEVIRNFGTGEYVHAFMGTALAMYLRHIRENQSK